jgi:hypothetical protein
MKEDTLISTEEQRCCGHTGKKEDYIACIGNFIDIHTFMLIYQNLTKHTLHIPHPSVRHSYMLYILISFISLCLERISELEGKILSPCRNNTESALYPKWTFYTFCDASTMG